MREVHLDHTGVGGDNLGWIKKNPHLQWLVLGHNYLRDQDGKLCVLKSLAHANRLIYLDLENMLCDAEDMQVLGTLPNLQYLFDVLVFSMNGRARWLQLLRKMQRLIGVRISGMTSDHCALSHKMERALPQVDVDTAGLCTD